MEFLRIENSDFRLYLSGFLWTELRSLMLWVSIYSSPADVKRLRLKESRTNNIHQSRVFNLTTTKSVFGKIRFLRNGRNRVTFSNYPALCWRGLKRIKWISINRHHTLESSMQIWSCSFSFLKQHKRKQNNFLKATTRDINSVQRSQYTETALNIWLRSDRVRLRQ